MVHSSCKVAACVDDSRFVTCFLDSIHLVVRSIAGVCCSL